MHGDDQLIEDYLASIKQVKQAFAGMSESAAKAGRTHHLGANRITGQL